MHLASWIYDSARLDKKTLCQKITNSRVESFLLYFKVTYKCTSVISGDERLQGLYNSYQMALTQWTYFELKKFYDWLQGEINKKIETAISNGTISSTCELKRVLSEEEIIQRNEFENSSIGLKKTAMATTLKVQVLALTNKLVAEELGCFCQDLGQDVR